MNTVYSIECQTCKDGDLGTTADYREARSRANSHNTDHRVRLYEDGVTAS